jgi:hypothetical protein
MLPEQDAIAKLDADAIRSAASLVAKWRRRGSGIANRVVVVKWKRGGNACVVDNKDKERGCDGATKRNQRSPASRQPVGSVLVIFCFVLNSGGWESVYWVLVG